MHEDLLRLLCFLGVFATMALAEILAPRRRLASARAWRWLSNLGLSALNSFVVRLLLPMGATGMAVFAEARGLGLFNNIELPAWILVVASVVMLDFVIYLQHVLFHALPFLWRLHRVHHADLDFDVTTGVRFHTIEIIISMGIKLAVVLLLGVPALAVLIFEVVLNATSVFNHANLKLPRSLDFALRLVLVTPDMHRIHHSTDSVETNSNFGFSLPWWDFLLGTYRANPEKSHEAMMLGVADLRDENSTERLAWMLALPFMDPPNSKNVPPRDAMN